MELSKEMAIETKPERDREGEKRDGVSGTERERNGGRGMPLGAQYKNHTT